MNRLIVGLCLCFFTHPLLASDVWSFEQKIAVTAKPVKGVFHHLEGAGRKHIAVSGDSIAVSWEDDHSKDPQIYVTSKKTGDHVFSKKLQVSTGLEAYEPAIAALTGSQFILAWEQDGSVYVRSLSGQRLSMTSRLSTDTASQVSLATTGHNSFAVWREQRGRSWSLWVARLDLDSTGLLVVTSKSRVEPVELDTPVLFPTIAVNDVGLMVAWEDRQSGHTRLKYSYSVDNGSSFSESQYLNEFFSNRNKYDKGSGVTRVSMSAYAEDELVAAWMDKRRGGTGYGIFAALGSDDSFGPNEKVHSKQGDTLPHYNPATAGNNAGNFAVAWDDYRQG
ncbi:MAG: hypothetical protein HN977_11650, partial [Gammaproteobacteria bacterium]|nr:hypothetical protein [Gammaproteobacteria bacterium]